MAPLNEAAVYWIRLPEHTDPLTEGYVGVSKNWSKRFRDHMKDIKKRSHTNTHFMNAALKYGVENLVADVILMGEEKFCYEVESSLRPKRKIGWNLAPGGHRGPGRNKGSPGKIRSPEEQAVFDEKRRLAEDVKIENGRNREIRRLASIERKKELGRQREIRRLESIEREKELERWRSLKISLEPSGIDEDLDSWLSMPKYVPPPYQEPLSRMSKKKRKQHRHHYDIHIREEEIRFEITKFQNSSVTDSPLVKERVNTMILALTHEIVTRRHWLGLKDKYLAPWVKYKNE